MIGYYIFLFSPGLINILVLLWWRFNCICSFKNKFPTRANILFITFISFVPIIGLVLTAILLGFYFGFRVTGDIKLKKNKFNKYWFDVDE